MSSAHLLVITVVLNWNNSADPIGYLQSISRLRVDTERFRPLSLAREHCAVSVGVLTSDRGFGLAIRGLAQIQVTEQPALTIISDHGYLAEHGCLRKLSSGLGVTVVLRAGVADQALVEGFSRSRLTGYTPVMEPFGSVPLESTACEKPVSRVREACVRESVSDGEAGLLVDRKTAQMTAAIRSLLDRRSDAVRLGNNGRQCAETRWIRDTAIDNTGWHLLQTAQSRTA